MYLIKFSFCWKLGFIFDFGSRQLTQIFIFAYIQEKFIAPQRGGAMGRGGGKHFWPPPNGFCNGPGIHIPKNEAQFLQQFEFVSSTPTLPHSYSCKFHHMGAEKDDQTHFYPIMKQQTKTITRRYDLKKKGWPYSFPFCKDSTLSTFSDFTVSLFIFNGAVDARPSAFNVASFTTKT